MAMEARVRDQFKQFLTDEQGGAVLEFALVSALAMVAGVAAVGAVQNGQVPLLPDVHRKLIAAVGEINRSLP